MARHRTWIITFAVAIGCSTTTLPRAPVTERALAHDVSPPSPGPPAPAALPSPGPASQAPPPPRELTWAQRESLRAALAAARKRQIVRLRAYRKAGQFPTREGVFHEPEMARPLFVDASGVPCAVGYLMQQSGWTEEVAAIAAATPFVKVEEVTSGPIVEWVLRSGLTQDEATLIQPDYQSYIRQQAQQFVRERRRLKRHFLAVENQLIANTEVSLDIAMVRIIPMFVATPSLDELGDRPARR